MDGLQHVSQLQAHHIALCSALRCTAQHDTLHSNVLDHASMLSPTQWARTEPVLNSLGAIMSKPLLSARYWGQPCAHPAASRCGVDLMLTAIPAS